MTVQPNTWILLPLCCCCNNDKRYRVVAVAQCVCSVYGRVGGVEDCADARVYFAMMASSAAQLMQVQKRATYYFTQQLCLLQPRLHNVVMLLF